LSAEDSLDPMATVGLFDLTVGSPGFGTRIPFQLRPRDDSIVGQGPSYVLVLFPSIPLQPGGRYGVVVTRRALATSGEPFNPSPFFRSATSNPVQDESEEITRARPMVQEVLAAIASSSSPLPIQVQDVALALRVSVRSTDSIPADALAMKQQIASRPPPAFEITRQSQLGNSVVLEGTWEAPNWRGGSSFLVRDENGVPRITGQVQVPFLVRIPLLSGSQRPALTMYQHGNPGSPDEILNLHYLIDSGFAVAGFQDTLNREVGQNIDDQIFNLFGILLLSGRIPDYYSQTLGEQLAFLRVLEQLRSLDVLPVGSPDGIPDLDPDAPLTYLGVSQGAIHGQALLPYAAEIRAAALVTGGSRLAETLFHQDITRFESVSGFLDLLPAFVPNISAQDVWVGLSIFQMRFDRQDAHNHAAFLYRNRIPVLGSIRRPSVLVIEGINDSAIPNNATRSLAWTAGPLPHLRPVFEAVPGLEPTDGPVEANIDSETTGAYVQYFCGSFEGHFCGQSQSEPLQVAFFHSAVDGPVPRLVGPAADSGR
jgi:hypothetical protein